MDAILAFQGGGSLGAYECGAYQALAPWLRANGHRLAVVSGTSIGAINASIIAARHGDPDQGVGALEAFWFAIANRSLPFFPPLGELTNWNAVWTSLLFGNPRLFNPSLPFWPLLAPIVWAPFHSMTPRQWRRRFGNAFQSHGPQRSDPRLIVTAVDLKQIRSVAFDSWETRITPQHVVACCSLPPSFPATPPDGSQYWDGGLWSNTPLRDVLNCLQKPRAPAPADATECIVFIVDLFGPADAAAPMISTNWDVWALRDRVLFKDKAEYDEKAATRMNDHIGRQGMGLAR
jgi:NTE family protein